MTRTSTKPLRIFFSYSREDATYLEKLQAWLVDLRREGLIREWYDGMIGPGERFDEAIEENLKNSDIIILLVSQDFMSSDYVYEKEIRWAIEKYERSEASVIPIIVRPAMWKKAFGELQALPKDGKPIVNWSNPDDAWFDVAQKIAEEVEKLADKRSKDQQVTDQMRDEIGRSQIQFRNIPQQGETSISVLAERLRLRSERRDLASDPKDEFSQTRVLTSPGKIPEDRAIIDGLNNKVGALYENNQLAEAVKYNDVVLDLDPNDPVAWYCRGLILAKLELHDEALDAFREAADRRQNYPGAWSVMLGNSSERNGVA